jgi:uncharacterized protein
MDLLTLSIICSGLFFAGTLKGATGLGYASCALPFLVVALGLKPAMALVAIPAMATNIGVAFATGHMKETLRTFARMYISIIPGVIAGVCLLLWVDQWLATRVLGVTIIAYVILSLAKPTLILPSIWHRRLQVPTGFANGMLSGLTGSQVMPLWPYMMALHLPPDRMVQAVNFAVLITSLMLAGGLFTTGIMTWTLLGLSVIAIAPALCGVAIGIKARTMISERRFRTIVLIILGVMGALMLVR